MQNEKIKNNELLPSEMRMIKFAMAEMFFGLARANQVQGKLLGTSREDALAQIASFIKTKNPDNIVVQYMRQVFMENHNKWAEMIVKSKKSQTAISHSPEYMAKNKAWGAGWANAGMAKLNEKIAEFNGVAPMFVPLDRPQAEQPESAENRGKSSAPTSELRKVQFLQRLLVEKNYGQVA